ncbi:MAG: o-succinylbenzoate synthase [Deinococcus sp.]|nr:o-succinylbenzoate synthase [Deinococcus sp.]
MKIERWELGEVHLELLSPFETSFGRTSTKRALILRLFSQGLVGYGECVALEHAMYSYETPETCRHMLERYLLPQLAGRELAGPQDAPALCRHIRGHNMAKATLEMALWDLFARAKGLSLSAYLGGTRRTVDSGISLGIEASIAALLERTGAALNQGYTRVKIKIKPGWDLAPVRAIRERFGTIKLMADANSAYTLADAALFQELDRFQLLMIEQPLDYEDIIDHATLQGQLQTPICLDESIHSREDARKAFSIGACRMINIKAGRVGGLGPAKAIHDLARAQGKAVWCGGMLETGIGRACNLALASLPGFTLPGDLSASARYFPQDIVDPPARLNGDGTISVPTGPGIGVTVDDLAIQPLARSEPYFS